MTDQIRKVSVAVPCYYAKTRVLRVRYGLDDGVYRSIRECGEILGMPKDAVRGICSRAFRKLKETERGLALSNYDGILESPGSS